jgi:radical S-adenosyl methionine domain-containing protein 2
MASLHLPQHPWHATTVVVAALVLLLAGLAARRWHLLPRRWRDRVAGAAPSSHTTAPSHGTHPTPISVNYHFSRKCNYACFFCFHTAKTSARLRLDDAKRGLRLLRDAGTRKVNFAGGEPFLPEHCKYLGELVRFAKETLEYESVSIVSNASQRAVMEAWFAEYGRWLDVLGVSCDSADEQTNVRRRCCSCTTSASTRSL